jgi:Phage Mu protein F like protein
MSKRDITKAQSIWELASPELRAELLTGERAKLFAKIAERERAETLLAQSSGAVSRAFRGYVANATSPAFMRYIRPLLARGDVAGVLRLIDLHTAAFANGMAAVFVGVANAETVQLAPKLVRKATPTVALSFNVADPRAVRLMEANRLRHVQGLSRMQQQRVRAALVRSVQESLGTTATSRLLRAAIGLSEGQQREVERYRQLITPTELGRKLDPEAEHLTPQQVSRMVAGKVEQSITSRAERIGRTESLVITSQARDEALRQSLEATGQRAELSGKEWASTRDSRTRDSHAARDGQRRRLNEAFDGGIMKPGDGGPEEAVNCRCTLLYEFFDAEPELKTWLSGGS